jgi:superfamily II DNA helicase RecQ
VSSCHWISREQKEVAEYVGNGAPCCDVLVVLRTGGGKSAVIVVPELQEKTERAVTVIVAPFVELLREVRRRVAYAGIRV